MMHMDSVSVGVYGATRAGKLIPNGDPHILNFMVAYSASLLVFALYHVSNIFAVCTVHPEASGSCVK